MDAVALVLFVFGYPVSIAVIARWVLVVREQRIRWFLWHQAAVAAIVLGWVVHGRTSAVVVNGTWFLVAGAWFLVAGRSRAGGDAALPSRDG